MSENFSLIIQDQNQQLHTIEYELADNPIAQQWFQKIKHLWRIPLCYYYTSTKHDITNLTLFDLISQDLQWLNDRIGFIYKIKEFYTIQDFNNIHILTVNTQYQYNQKIRNVFHRLHRRIHMLEDALSSFVPSVIHAGWGEKEGMLTTTFKESPYNFYVPALKSGNLYMVWNEFGKTPYRFWQNQDPDTLEHFISTCKPQLTFRAEFVFCYKDRAPYEFEPEFKLWFNRYQNVWTEKWNMEWNGIHERGGIPLAIAITNHQFETTSTIKSVNLIVDPS